MTTLDRYILRGLVFNYVIAIAVMTSLYVVLDLFFNMDEFTEKAVPATEVALDIASFYGNRVFLYFAQLSGIITLFACLITLARMRRMNELTAMLASGISLYRVAAPVVAFAVFTTALWYVDTEVVIPSIAHKLARRHDDARGTKTYGVWFLDDRDEALLSAQQFLPSEDVLKRMLVMKRDASGDVQSVIEAEIAHWEPAVEDEHTGRWKLERGIERRRMEDAGDIMAPGADMERSLVSYYESELDPRAIEMRQSAGWIRYLSSARLNQLSKQVDTRMLRQVLQAKHARFTTPLVSLVMLLLGLPFILDRVPGSILTGSVGCMVICGACFLLHFITQNLGITDSLSALPAWLPIIIFTPVAVVLMDRMRT